VARGGAEGGDHADGYAQYLQPRKPPIFQVERRSLPRRG
jgi:hypothetical protein